jgi:hypothetical protein
MRTLRIPFLEVFADSPNYWTGLCEYGRVNITSNEKMLRITVSKSKGKNAQHITCKYDKYGNFRAYYSCNKGVRDIVYNLPFALSSYIESLLNKITNVNQNRYASDKVLKEYRSRFIRIFGEDASNIDKIANVKFDALIWKLIYPLNSYEKGVHSVVPSFIRRPMRSNDPKEFTMRLFGKAPKSLVKSVILHMPFTDEFLDILFLAKIFYHIWPIDKVVEFLRKAAETRVEHGRGYRSLIFRHMYPTRDNSNIMQIRVWRSFLRKFTPNKIINSFCKYRLEFGQLVCDTLKQLSEFKERNIKVTISSKMDINQVHDVVSRYYMRLSRPEKALPVYDLFYEINNEDIMGYKVVFPKTNYDLINWGKKMQICVGSYASSVERGNSVIFALFKDRVPKYCVEYRPKIDGGFRMAACKGRSNKNATDEMREAINKKCWAPTLGLDAGQVENAKLVYPESHKIKVKELPDHINLEKEELVGV